MRIVIRPSVAVRGASEICLNKTTFNLARHHLFVGADGRSSVGACLEYGAFDGAVAASAGGQCGHFRKDNSLRRVIVTISGTHSTCESASRS